MFVILALRAVGVALLTTLVTFRSDYEAAMLVAGQCGFGLGATPIANMQAVCERYGYAPRAFIIMPVVGAFLIAIANAIVTSAFATVLPALRWPEQAPTDPPILRLSRQVIFHLHHCHGGCDAAQRIDKAPVLRVELT